MGHIFALGYGPIDAQLGKLIHRVKAEGANAGTFCPKTVQGDCQIRQAALQTAKLDRDHVQQARGLATCRNQTRQMFHDILLCIALATVVIYWL